jgi:hypothetical protein
MCCLAACIRRRKSKASSKIDDVSNSRVYSRADDPVAAVVSVYPRGNVVSGAPASTTIFSSRYLTTYQPYRAQWVATHTDMHRGRRSAAVAPLQLAVSIPVSAPIPTAPVANRYRHDEIPYLPKLTSRRDVRPISAIGTNRNEVTSPSPKAASQRDVRPPSAIGTNRNVVTSYLPTPSGRRDVRPVNAVEINRNEDALHRPSFQENRILPVNANHNEDTSYLPPPSSHKNVRPVSAVGFNRNGDALHRPSFKENRTRPVSAGGVHIYEEISYRPNYNVESVHPVGSDEALFGRVEHIAATDDDVC